MRFFTFIRTPGGLGDPPPALLKAMEQFIADKFADGSLVSTGGLAPSAQGTRVAVRGGKLTFTDGPFTEAKEVIGGYAILEGKSKDDAIRVATEFMQLHADHWPEFEGESEVRAIDFLTP